MFNASFKILAASIVIVGTGFLAGCIMAKPDSLNSSKIKITHKTEPKTGWVTVTVSNDADSPARFDLRLFHPIAMSTFDSTTPIPIVTIYGTCFNEEYLSDFASRFIKPYELGKHYILVLPPHARLYLNFPVSAYVNDSLFSSWERLNGKLIKKPLNSDLELRESFNYDYKRLWRLGFNPEKYDSVSLVSSSVSSNFRTDLKSLRALLKNSLVNQNFEDESEISYEISHKDPSQMVCFQKTPDNRKAEVYRFKWLTVAVP